MFDLFFRISQMTLPVATIFCTTWSVVSGKSWEAFFIFMGGVAFTLILRLAEQQIFEYNSRNGYY